MIFIKTENLNLVTPSKENLTKWSLWVNSSDLRK